MSPLYTINIFIIFKGSADHEYVETLIRRGRGTTQGTLLSYNTYNYNIYNTYNYKAKQKAYLKPHINIINVFLLSVINVII